MKKAKLRIYFSDFFEVDPSLIDDYGAFNISLINDLPLFVDPFLLFTSTKPDYKELHNNLISYVRFLKTKSARTLPDGLVKSWFYFPEVKQNWLGYSKIGNSGRGLGKKFASSLKLNLTTVFKDFGEEKKTGAHLEKLTLIKNGVGKDQISDFTCNLISGYLAKYTEEFAKAHIAPAKLGKFMVPKVNFDFKTETWASRQFILPKYGNQYVLLTPIDILTKDETWISHRSFVEDFSSVVASVSNTQLRSQIDNYFASVLPTKPTSEDVAKALEKVVEKYPEVLDLFIKYKEENRSEALIESSEKIKEAQNLFVKQLREFIELLDSRTKFYLTDYTSFQEAIDKINFLKYVIEKQDGYKLFYVKGKPVKREQDLQIMFKLTWFASKFDMNSEANNGRGPADFIVSYGSSDKSVIEFKLASNKQLEKNLINQAEIYAVASRANHPPIKVILYFKNEELIKVKKLLEKHKLTGKKEIILIDATPSKPSASRAGSK